MFEPRLGRERSGPGLASMLCLRYALALADSMESKGRVVQYPRSGIQS